MLLTFCCLCCAIACFTLDPVQLDVTQMDPFMTELFGRGNREGLLHWIRDGTLAIYNVHKAVRAHPADV
jgi:hypothetical protein